MKLTKAMYDEALDEFEKAGTMQLGEDTHTKTVQAANSIVDRIHKAEEIENEKRRLDIEERRLDIEERKNEIDSEGRKMKDILTTVCFVIGTGVSIWANIDSKRFEQGFTHTTDAGRNSTKKLLNLADKIKFW